MADQIRRGIARLTPSERRPAQALLANYPLAGLETVAHFAECAGVSAPTVLRFVGKLGFSGYAAFQKALREELGAQIQSPLTKAHGASLGDADGARFLERFAGSVTGNIERAVESVSQEDFDGVVELLSQTRRGVFLLGGRFTDALAAYFYLHLHTLRPKVVHIEQQIAVRLEYLLDMGRNDVLVVFDVRRYQGDVVHFAEQAARRGVTVVLFTDQWLSPISRSARHVFALPIEAPSSWDSAVATLAVVEAMIAALNDRQWPKIKTRIERLEDLRGSLASRGSGGIDVG